MRLWHIDLIPYLPKSQLLAQWRELNSIFKKQDKHILINYVYDYDKTKILLLVYTCKVVEEMSNRNIKIKSFDNCYNYFSNDAQIIERAKFERLRIIFPKDWHFPEHNDEYLTICFMNLLEKYRRGQKDFDKLTFDKLYDFVNSKINLKAIGIER